MSEMIHYHVWFNLKQGITEAEGLQVVREFLEELQAEGSVAGYRLLKNQGAAPRTKLPSLHALIEFAGSAQFAAAFSAQATKGIHTGLHGRVLEIVSEFQIEVFHEIAPIPEPSVAISAALQACEI